MSPTSILVLSDRTLVSLSLQDSLRGDRDEVVCIESPRLACELIDAQAVDMVAIDADGELSREVLDAAARARMPIMSLASRPERAIALLPERGIDNLLVCPNSSAGGLALDVPDLIATKTKLLSRALFGLHHYVRGDAVTYTIDDHVGTHRVAICVRDDLRRRGLGNQRASRVALLAHQIATSVLDGVDRGARAAGEPIEITCMHDEHTLGVSVRFGGLTASQLRSLVRYAVGDDVCPSDPVEDFGLPAAFSWCRTLVINARPGQETEIIGLVEPRPDDRRPRSSLHVCVNPRPQDQAVVSEKINLSDTMRQELRAAAAAGGAVPNGGAPRRAMDLGAAIGAIRQSLDTTEALRHALRYLSQRCRGAVVFEVGARHVSVWGAAGTIAHPAELRRYVVSVHDASTFAFLAREPALMRGQATSELDRYLARLVAGFEGAFGMSVSVVVGGGVSHILHACDPVLERGQAARELEVLADELSRALRRFHHRDAA